MGRGVWQDQCEFEGRILIFFVNPMPQVQKIIIRLILSIPMDKGVNGSHDRALHHLDGRLTDYDRIKRLSNALRRSLSKKYCQNVRKMSEKYQKTIMISLQISSTQRATLPTIGTSGILEPFGLLQIAIAAYG
jgi:hypothetical protein